VHYLIGDPVECFSGGQLKQLFLSQWIANELHSCTHMPEETRKMMCCACEVSLHGTSITELDIIHQDLGRIVVVTGSGAPLVLDQKQSANMLVGSDPCIHEMRNAQTKTYGHCDFLLIPAVGFGNQL